MGRKQRKKMRWKRPRLFYITSEENIKDEMVKIQSYKVQQNRNNSKIIRRVKLGETENKIGIKGLVKHILGISNAFKAVFPRNYLRCL